MNVKTDVVTPKCFLPLFSAWPPIRFAAKQNAESRRTLLTVNNPKRRTLRVARDALLGRALAIPYEQASDWVVQQLVDVVKKSKEPEPVMEWDYDEKALVKTGEYTFDSKGATKALELLGKHLGMYVEKVEEKVDMQIKIEIDYGDEVEDK